MLNVSPGHVCRSVCMPCTHRWSSSGSSSSSSSSSSPSSSFSSSCNTATSPLLPLLPLPPYPHNHIPTIIANNVSSPFLFLQFRCPFATCSNDGHCSCSDPIAYQTVGAPHFTGKTISPSMKRRIPPVSIRWTMQAAPSTSQAGAPRCSQHSLLRPGDMFFELFSVSNLKAHPDPTLPDPKLPSQPYLESPATHLALHAATTVLWRLQAAAIMILQRQHPALSRSLPLAAVWTTL